MKYVLALIMLCLTACASTTQTKTSGSVYEPKTYRVVGNGRTIDEAKIDGFNSAIEFAVGFVILSDKEAKNDRMVRDDMAKHSAGYIDGFTIIDQLKTNRGVTLVMDVTVKSSKIAERMLNRGVTEGVVAGEKLSDQYNSYLNERKTGDRFINSVLASYPKNAYNVTQGKVDFKLDAYRNSIIVIPYQVRWNYDWVVALKESLSVIQDGDYKSPDKITVTAKKPGDWSGKSDTYNFNDSIRVKKIADALGVQTYVLVKIISKNNRTIYTGCYAGMSQDMYSYQTHNKNRAVYGHAVINNEAHIEVKPGSTLHANLHNMDKVEMSVVDATNSLASCNEKAN